MIKYEAAYLVGTAAAALITLSGEVSHQGGRTGIAPALTSVEHWRHPQQTGAWQEGPPTLCLELSPASCRQGKLGCALHPLALSPGFSHLKHNADLSFLLGHIFDICLGP